MAPGSATPQPPTLRHLQHELQSASDDQLVRVVHLLDGLETRGSADGMIAPMRGRLAQLRPARRLTFGRLLFTPADPLVVPAPDWSRGGLAVPRTALPPLAAQLRAELGDLATEVAAIIQGGRSEDTALVLRAGRKLWPAASAALDRLGPPSGWSEATGLTAADHTAIARCAACVLSEAVWIQTSMHAAAEGLGPDPEDLRAWLDVAVSLHPEPPGALMAVVMARLPGAAALVGALPPQAAHGAAQVEPAIDYLLGRLEAEPRRGYDPVEEATTIQRAAALLDALDAPGPGHRPSRKPRTERLRRTLIERCRTRFTDRLTREVLAPLAEAATQGEIAALEETARGLRRLESAGRRLGGGDHYDRTLRAAAREIGEGGSGSAVERARLVEILAGPDAALALLQS
jgi:hypothetical protein